MTEQRSLSGDMMADLVGDERHRQTNPDAMGYAGGLLADSLAIAVPLWAERWKGRDLDRAVDRARDLADQVAAHGDNILYRSKGHGPRKTSDGSGAEGKPGTAEAFNMLAEGIAIASLIADGGCTIFGIHFHDGCPARSIAECVERRAGGCVDCDDGEAA